MEHEQRSVQLVSALARIWAKIREYHSQVPGVVVLAAPNPHRATNVLGHFAALRWKVRKETEGIHEVVVVAEHLNRTAEDITETLLHEAAHAMNFARQVADCSRSQYHNARFKEAAEEIGLSVERVPHYGWALTRLPDTTACKYLDVIEELRAVLIHRHRTLAVPSGPGPTGDDSTDGEDAPRSRHLKATCKCSFVIRVARKTLASTSIRCESCGEAFQVSQ
ncbi:MAG: hypothetical protein JWO36_5741 [Myxococcales bacterium]|nr:hypothetical protein [Myxococcales bacterium]